MDSKPNGIDGVVETRCTRFVDFRGELVKPYTRDLLKGLVPHVEELYVSKSDRDVVRGLHYQVGQYAQDKLIYCIFGRMLDVSVDLRPGPTLGKVTVHELDGLDNKLIMIPGHFAHGIIALEDSTVFINISPQRYKPGVERGVRWDTLGIDFGIQNPKVTEKDQSWPALGDVLNRIKRESV